MVLVYDIKLLTVAFDAGFSQVTVLHSYRTHIKVIIWNTDRCTYKSYLAACVRLGQKIQ